MAATRIDKPAAGFMANHGGKWREQRGAGV
jgi:hypothetical protein